MSKHQTVAPSSWHVEMAMATAQSFASRLRLEDPDTDHDTLLLALDSETDILDLIRRVVRALEESKAFAAACGERIAALSTRKARYTEREGTARQLLFAMMESLLLKKLEEPDFTVSIKDGQQRATVNNIDLLSERYVRRTLAPDMDAINAAWKSGVVPDGVEIVTGLPILTIRTK